MIAIHPLRKRQLVIAVLLLLLFICPVRVSAQGLTLAQKIDNYIKQKVAASKIPGVAIAVVHLDTVIIAKGYGATSNGQPINATTPFAIASLSKAFTATAVLQLAAAGKLNLDEPVIKYLPSFLPAEPLRAKLTIRHLLNQTSGMADTGYPEFVLKDNSKDLEEAVNNLRSAHLVSMPGTKFHYHNPNYLVLARIVEVVSGEQFSAYLKRHIFTPLSMSRTNDSGNVTEFFNSTNNLPKGHIYAFGQPVAYTEPAWFVDGPAGIVSNVNDMAKWLSAQLDTANGGGVLKGKFLNVMQTPPTGVPSGYGMGWHIRDADQALYHSGIMWTYSSQEILLTKQGYGIVALFNGGLDNLTDYYSFLQGIQDILNNEKPDVGAFPRWLYTVGIIILLIAIVFAGVRRLMRTKQWHNNYNNRKRWKTWLRMVLRLLPLCLLVFIPQLVTLLNGRVLSWSLIALMCADLIITMALIALMNTLIIISRLIYLNRNRQ